MDMFSQWHVMMFDLFQNRHTPTMLGEQDTDRHTHKMATPQVTSDEITKTCPCNIQGVLNLQKMKNFNRKCLIISLFLLKT